MKLAIPNSREQVCPIGAIKIVRNEREREKKVISVIAKG